MKKTETVAAMSAIDIHDIDSRTSTTLKMYLNGDLKRDEAAGKLMRMFPVTAGTDAHGDIHAHIERLLDSVSRQSLNINDARRAILRAVQACAAGDTHFVRLLDTLLV